MEMVKITNDTTTLNGSLEQLGITMATNLVSMGVTNASASDGLTTLAGKILNIAPSVGGITPTVSIDISKTPSTVYAHDSVLLSAKVNADYDDTSQVDVDLKGVLQGATVTFKNNGIVIGTAVTGLDGIATYTMTNVVTGNYSITAHFDGSNTDYESATSSALIFSVNHNYSLAFSQASYTASGGSCTVECTLLDNGVAVSGETVTLSDGTSQYSGITNQNGVVQYTFTGLTASVNITASYSNVSDTCSIRVVNYIINDDCSSDNSSTLFDSYISIRNGTATAIYDSSVPCYQIKNTRGSAEAFIPLKPLEGITDSFQITYLSKTTTSSVCPIGLYYYIDSNNWGGVKDESTNIWISSKTNGSFTESNKGGRNDKSNIIKTVITFNATAKTLKIDRYDSTGTTLINTQTMTIPSAITIDSTVKWGTTTSWDNNTIREIYSIQAEYI